MENIIDIETEINSILLMNRNVLKWNHDRKQKRVSKIELVLQGFVFPYHTHEMKHQDRDQLFEFCYEYGIGKLYGDWYEIIRLPF